MRTTFSAERMEYTKRAHLAAREQFYPAMFSHLPIRFEDTVGTVRDLKYAIDCQLAVKVAGLGAPLRFSVQERWRRPTYRHFGDVSITERNLASGEPSELHKFGAQLFVYGFYDDRTARIEAAVALRAVVMLRQLALGRLEYGRRARIDQTFLTFPLTILESIGAVDFKYCA